MNFVHTYLTCGQRLIVKNIYYMTNKKQFIKLSRNNNVLNKIHYLPIGWERIVLSIEKLCSQSKLYSRCISEFSDIQGISLNCVPR